MLTFARSGLALGRVDSDSFRSFARLAGLAVELSLLAADDVRRNAGTFADRIAVFVFEAKEARDGSATRVRAFGG